jgi:6-hydroxynicotinate reductase
LRAAEVYGARASGSVDRRPCVQRMRCARRICCRHLSSARAGHGTGAMTATRLSVESRSKQFGAAEGDGIIRCDACPVLCRIRSGRAGACARYANEDGQLVRTDPVVLLSDAVQQGRPVVAFTDGALNPSQTFVTGIGAGTTYPDYKPAPFIVGQEHDGVDTVTVVTEGIFSYCGVKVKIDTDRHLGPESAAIRVNGEQVGHVTTAEYGSQMLSIGGVRHLTGGTKKEGIATCETLLALCNGEAVDLTIDGGHTVTVAAGKAPIVDGKVEQRMRVGCGSATVGIFAQQWAPHVDEVIVVDDHITGVLTEHQAGRVLDMRPSGIRVRGRKSTPGRYFKVAEPGLGWGGTDITDPLAIIHKIDPALAWPGLRLLLTSTTGEDALYCVLDDQLKPVPATMPIPVAAVVARIAENCEPSICSVLFMAGAGGSLRAGVTTNPVLLTRSVASGETTVTMGGAPVHVWAGGGITLMCDVTTLPKNAFGYVPTPAIVAPIEFTLPRALYASLGGHMDSVVPVADVVSAFGATARIERRR